MFAVPTGEQADEQHGPQSNMYHHVSGVENVVPVGDVLHVDEVDNTAVQQSVHDIAGAATGNKTEADEFVGPDMPALQQIYDQSDDQQAADQCKYPALALEYPEYTSQIANVCEVQEAVNHNSLALGNMAVHQITAELGQGKCRNTDSGKNAHQSES